MKSKLALISTGIRIAGTITTLIKEITPDVEIINIADDSIIRTIAANKNVIPSGVFRRLTTYIVLAEEAGVDAVLVTCSSISEVVDIAKSLVKIPVFKIDGPMTDKAVATGKRIGVAATLATTLEPSKRLLFSTSEKAGKVISIDETLCEGARDALESGDADKHDEIIRNEVKALLDKCDVVVLAQASMARAAQDLVQFQDRILTSPLMGVNNVLNYLKSK